MLWRWKWLAGLTVTGCVPGTQSAPIGINVSLFLCFIRVTLEKQGRLVSLAFLSPECLPGLATFMRSGRTWKGESHVPKLLGILRARQQRGRRSGGQFWAGARALARSQACAISLGTRLCTGSSLVHSLVLESWSWGPRWAWGSAHGLGVYGAQILAPELALTSPISLRLVPLLGTGLTMRGPWRAQVRDGWDASWGEQPPPPALRTHRSAVVTTSFLPLNLFQVFRLCDSNGVMSPWRGRSEPGPSTCAKE